MNQLGFWKLDDISDERLVGNLKELLVADARTEARIVAHLAELDARRLHLKLEQSLFHYCQKRLGLSDNQAYSPRPDVPSQIRKLPPKAGTVSAGPTGSLEPLSETSYRLQLNTSPAVKEKLELARDLMSHANRSGDLAVVVERALDLLIEKLQKQRFGQTSHPRRRKQEAPSQPTGAQTLAGRPRRTEGHSTAPAGGSEPSGVRSIPAPSASEMAGASVSADLRGARRFDRSKRGRSEGRAHIPNETRRKLVERDGLCCSYVGDDGRRCTARAFLQIDHEKPWAKGGLDTLDNLRLRCAAHNQLRAEQEYGVSHIRRAIGQERRR